MKGTTIKIKPPRKSDIGSVPVKAESPDLSSGSSSTDDEERHAQGQKKLPRVILKLGAQKGIEDEEVVVT